MAFLGAAAVPASLFRCARRHAADRPFCGKLLGLLCFGNIKLYQRLFFCDYKELSFAPVVVFLHVEHPHGFCAACTCRQLHLMMLRRRKKNKKHLHAPSHPRGAIISNTAFFINLTLNSFHTCAARFLFGSQTKARSLWKLRPQTLKRHVTSQFVRI